MTVKDSITAKLQEAFAPARLEVINESHLHSTPPDSETHFKVVVVSEAFAGQRQAQRHRQVYGALALELAEGVHALAIHTYTTAEWAEAAGAPDSPDCLGGGKSN